MKIKQKLRFILPVLTAFFVLLFSVPFHVYAEGEPAADQGAPAVSNQNETGQGQNDPAAPGGQTPAQGQGDPDVSGGRTTSEGQSSKEDQTPEEPETSGTCGTGLSWAYEEGVLTISGELEQSVMNNYTEISAEEGTTAPWNAFRAEITKVQISTQGTLTIGAYAFSGLTGLTEVLNADKITAIGRYAFKGCSQLISIAPFTGLTSIGIGAFRASGLKNVTIPDGVTIVGAYSFSECTELAQVNLNKVTEIENYAFRGCTNLESADLNNQVSDIFPYAFSGCSKLQTISNMGAVSNIAHHAFYGCTALTTFKVPSGVQELNYNTFENCTGLKKVFIPKTVYINGTWSTRNPFVGCSETLVLFTEKTYTGSSWLPSMNVSSGVTEAVYELCKPNEEITSVDLSTLPNVPDYAFYNCTRLAETENFSSVKSIGEYAFYGCQGLKEIKIPSAVRELKNSSFGNCTGLTKVFIPATVAISATASPDNPFADCSSSLVLFTESTYTGSTWLAEMKVSAGITEAVYALCKPNEELLNVDLSAFTNIPDYAFYGCSRLEGISIPSTVNSIGKYAFHSCTDLEKAAFRTDACAIYENAFGNNAADFYVEGISGTDYYDYCVANHIPFVDPSPCTVHTLQHYEEVPATCTEPGIGEYWRCTVCGELFEDADAQTNLPSRPLTPRLPHTAGEPVHENEVPATCIAEGSYDEVVYCTVCETELSRVQKVVEKTDHTPAEPVKENEVLPTETTRGQYDEVVYCSVCTKELSRVTILVKIPTTIELSDKTVTYNKKAQKIDPAIVKGSTGEVTYSYFSDAECTVPVEAANVKTPGTYYAKAAVAEDENFLSAESNTASLVIKKAASTVTLSSKTANYTGKAVKIGKATVKGSTGKVTYTYYLDKSCKKVTTKANSGASASGKAPVYMGTYYVKAVVKADANYAAASKKVRLVIQPKTTFKYVSLYDTHPEYRYSGYPNSYYLYPTIRLTGVKYYTVTLYNSKGKVINNDKTKYYKAMEYGAKPKNAEFVHGQKYRLKVTAIPKKGRSVTVSSKLMKYIY